MTADGRIPPQPSSVQAQVISDDRRLPLAVTDHRPRLVSWTGQRAFLDIAASGCGTGCRYCYIAAPRAAQRLQSSAVMDQALEQLVGDSRFRPGVGGSLITLSPNTEPFKTTDSEALTNRILTALLPLGNSIQLATKERIPESTLAIADHHAHSKRQLVIFLSMTSLRLAAHLEPEAAPVAERVQNVSRVRQRRCTACVYIKPFLPVARAEVGQFVELLLPHSPELVCVGVLYRHAWTGDRHLSHPMRADFYATAVSSAQQEFCATLERQLGAHVFLTSTCVSSYLVDKEPPVPVWRDYPQLCVRCRACG
jgi:ferredoxin